MKAWYPAANPAEAEKQASTIASDVMLMGAIRVGQLCAKFGRKAFVYLITKETENEEGKRIGCLHCAEMPYLFGNVGKGGRSPFHDYQWVEKDFAFMRQIMGYYYNFAKSGDPNGKELAPWKKYESDYDVMVLANESHHADQSKVKPIYDYYMSTLMKAIKGSSRRFMMRLPGPAPVEEKK
jgi:para-nitrobenzyl esterase